MKGAAVGRGRAHPIAAGLGEYFELPNEEMYGERFDIRPRMSCFSFPGRRRRGVPLRLLLAARPMAGCSTSGPAMRPFPTYHNRNVQRVLANAVQWARRE